MSALKTLLALLTVLALGCGGALDVPGDCAMLEPATNPVVPCLYQLPAGAPCDEVRIYVDGVEQTGDEYTVVCGAGQVRILDGSGCAGAVVSACVAK